jgi:hypothetical protein
MFTNRKEDVWNPYTESLEQIVIFDGNMNKYVDGKVKESYSHDNVKSHMDIFNRVSNIDKQNMVLISSDGERYIISTQVDKTSCVVDGEVVHLNSLLLPFSNLLLFRFSKDNIFEGIYYQGAINL